jgi:type VI secretion system protein VasD
MPGAFLWVVCAALAACATPPPKPVSVKVTLTASADVNPDAQNRPSPIVVRIYQLKDDGAFKDADFFALYDKEAATLAAALVSRMEFELTPGQTLTTDYPVSPDTKFIGVAAAYRDIYNAQWHAQAGSAEKGVTGLIKDDKLKILIGRASVSLPAK